VAVARHFEQLEVDEEACIGGFLERLKEGTSGITEYSRITQHYDGHRTSTKRRRTKFAARPGEQVAAKVRSSMHAQNIITTYLNVCFILNRIIFFFILMKGYSYR
jgi:hypothetical protein